MIRRLTGELLLGLLGLGCTATTYQPARVVTVLPLDGAAFDLVAGILRQRYRGLAVMDRAAFKLQTRWLPIQPRDVPGQQRATVYRDEDGQLSIVVEVYYIRLGYGGLPETTPTTGDLRAEEELAGVLERALAAQRPSGGAESRI